MRLFLMEIAHKTKFKYIKHISEKNYDIIIKYVNLLCPSKRNTFYSNEYPRFEFDTAYAQ